MSTLPPGGGSPPPPVDPSDPCHAPACTQAIAKVIAQCPESCRGDLSIPVCDP
jgi:hypothetical protein